MTEKSYYLALQRPDGWPNEIVDGPHSTPEGVVKAQAIYERIMGKDEGQNYVMVSAEPLPEMTVEINEAAADECARLMGYGTGGLIDGETARRMSARIDVNGGCVLPADARDEPVWLCPDCKCVNADHEVFCYRCGRQGDDEEDEL